MAFPVADFTCIVNNLGASLLCNISWQPGCWRYCRRVSLFCFSVSYLSFTFCYKFAATPFWSDRRSLSPLGASVMLCPRATSRFLFLTPYTFARRPDRLEDVTRVCAGRPRYSGVLFFAEEEASSAQYSCRLCDFHGVLCSECWR